MSITEIAVRRPTAVFATFMALLGLGAFGYFNLGADLFPGTNIPYVAINSYYPGASASTVEEDLMKPIEDAVAGISGIESVWTSSSDGFGWTAIQFTMGTDITSAVNSVQEAINANSDRLPEDATRPNILKYSLTSLPMLVLAVSGNLPYENLRERADDLKKALENVEGVGKVDLAGAPAREVHIDFDMGLLDSYKLSIASMPALLGATNVNIPAGTVRHGDIERTLRIQGEFASLEQLRNFLVPLPRGGSIALREIATVSYNYPFESDKVRYNRIPAIGIYVSKASDANVVTVTTRINKVLGKVIARFPASVKVTTAADETTFIKSSLDETMRELLIGILSTAVVLFLFLRNWRSSIIVLFAIPASLISTFFAMYIAGFTLNVVSTMALAVCIGILVDDSIVILENINRHMRMHESPQEAAIAGRKEIAMAAIAITLCDVVVFTPVAFMSDIVGQFFRQYGLTVVFASLFSLFVSFTLTPALALRLHIVGKNNGSHNTEPKKPSAFLLRIQSGYRFTLSWALAHRAFVVGAVIILVGASIALIPLGFVTTEFMPSIDRSKLYIELTMDTGASQQRMDSVVHTVEEKLKTMPEVSSTFSRIGLRTGQNNAELTLLLVPKTKRKKSESTLARELRRWCSNLAGVRVSILEPQVVEQTSAEGRKPLIIKILGPDRDIIQVLATQIDSIVKATSGTIDVENSMQSRSTEYRLIVDPVALSQYGLTTASVAQVLNMALEGRKAGLFRESSNEYDIIMRIENSRLTTLNDIESLQILTAQGRQVSVHQIAHVARYDAPAVLNRSNRSDVATIQANLQSRSLGSVLADVKQNLKAAHIPPDYSVVFGGDTSLMADSFGSLTWALAASIILVYLILVVLYNSLITPVVRMLSLPAGIIGAFAALAITGKAINTISFIGIIMLDGLVSKNGTLLIDYTHTLLIRGRSLKDALIEAGSTRLQPIIMTSLTMIFGMLPLAISTGSSSEIRSGMAILLIGGLITSTIISPIFLPVAYTLIEDVRSHFRRSRQKSAQDTL